LAKIALFGPNLTVNFGLTNYPQPPNAHNRMVLLLA
jgi:hypothetical protein